MQFSIDQLITFFNKDTWVVQVFVVVFITLCCVWLQKRMLGKLQRRLEKNKTYWDDALVAAAAKPLSMLIWLIGLLLAAEIAKGQSDAVVFDAIGPIRDVGVITILSWFMVRFVRNAEEAMIRQRLQIGEPFDRTTAEAIAKLLRISIVITASLVILQNLGYSISGVLAFGGIGGIAVGFAARDLLANFFGGLMIYMDRPFDVGDWIRSPDREIEGTVEQIGWRLTRIRTFDKRPLYVPNAVFTTIAVENPSRMSNRRIYETIGIRYEDMNKMAAITDEVKAMLQTHPDIDARQTLIVNFVEYAPSSLNFFVYTFTKTTEWVRFHEIKQDVMLLILNIIEKHGAECAFPTTTVHLTEPPPDRGA
ncbi:MAG: mechanosensitive ion channel family protein [Gammaproteobacteria bacterium]